MPLPSMLGRPCTKRTLLFRSDTARCSTRVARAVPEQHPILEVAELARASPGSPKRIT